MSTTSSNDGYQAERRQTSLAIAGVQFAKKGSQPQSDGLAEAAGIWSTAAGEFRRIFRYIYLIICYSYNIVACDG